VIENGGYTLSVPPGTVEEPTEATVTPQAPDEDDVASGPAVDVHIDADWSDGTKFVKVTLPLPTISAGEEDEWEPGVVHDAASGDPDVYLRGALAIDQSAGTVTVEATSLSVFHATLFPISIVSAPSANYEGAIKSSEWALRIFRALIGQQAAQPQCSPPASPSRVFSTGNAFDPQIGRGGEARIKYCAQTGSDRIEWKLANNSGAVLHYTTADDARIEGVEITSDPLTALAYAGRNGDDYPQTEVDVPPGAEATVSVSEGSDGHVAFSAGDVGLMVETFTLQQIGSLLPESDAKTFYNALLGCGWSMGLSPQQLSSKLQCAQTAVGVASPRIAKAVEKPLLLLDAIAREIDTLDANIDPAEAELSSVAAGSLGVVTPIDAPLLPGSQWSIGLNDSGVPIATPDGRVFSLVCTSTAAKATNPMLELLDSTGTVAWAMPVGIDNTTYGCPHIAIDEDGNTYVQLLEPDGFWAESIDPTGTIRWAHKFPANAGSPLAGGQAVVSDGVVYFPSFTGYTDRIDGYDTATGAHVVTTNGYYLTALTAWSGGFAVIDLSGGNYRPVARYFDKAGNLVHEYPADDAVSANNGTWSFALDKEGGFLIAGTAECSGGTGQFAVESIGPDGERWLGKQAGSSGCAGSSVTPDADGGAYLMTPTEDGSAQVLRRFGADGEQWHRSLPGGGRIGEIHSDVNGVVVAATIHPYPCSDGSPPDSCTGTTLSFTEPDGGAARPDFEIEDPSYISYYQGIDSFAIGPGCVYVIRGSGDYHEETASISRIVTGVLGLDYEASIASG
jgi:outer membrane protein assembly factor BamB